MDKNLVKQRIQNYSANDLYAWKKHAVKCLDYYLKYRNDFEIEECNFVISHIDKRLKEIGNDK